jgi:hypothetical protein
MLWGIVVGLLQAATPLVLWWLDSATVALGLAVIAAAVTGSPWLLVAGLAGHGLKDLWQHRSHFVANTHRGCARLRKAEVPVRRARR